MARTGGETAVAGVIGSPVRHSRSPVIHNAAFAALGLDWVYLAFDVGEEKAAAAVRGAAALGFRGLSVTMPLKAVVLGAVDEVSETAATLGAVNTITFRDGRTRGDNTDGEGLLRALSTSAGWNPAGQHVAVVGAGGAARAAIFALGQAGAASIAVINRSAGPAERAAALGGPTARIGRVEDIAASGLVINATPVGMDGTEGAGLTPFDAALLHSGQVVVDLVYHPLETPLLGAAARAGAVAVDGLGMLVHQAALQFELWTGLDAPVDAMNEAARKG